MFRTNSSQMDEGRGKSVGGKMFNMTGLRYFKPKFLSNLNENANIHGKQKGNQSELKKTFVKKENVPPPDIQIFPKENMSKINSLSKKSQEKIKDNQILAYSTIRGLHNIGNTCYLNSTLQCLFHLPKFNTRFLKQMKKQSKPKADCANQYYDVIYELINSSTSSPINVATLKKSIGRKKPRFLGNSQQDAQQFLTNFLEIINEQLTRITTKPKYQELEGDPSKKSISEISDEWSNYYLKRDDSIICDFFQSQILSTVRCKKCAKKSVTFDNIWGLPISISKGKTVSQLMERFWQAESTIDDYYCSKCKKTSTCGRTVDFFRLPEVLVIQLKRFEYGKFTKRKINDEIKIEKNLNLENFLNAESKEKNGKYNLVGMIHHFGDTDFGHYIADVYDHRRKKWYQMNDSRAEQTTVGSSTKTGYILFYEKQ